VNELSLALDGIPYKFLSTGASIPPVQEHSVSRDLIYAKIAPTIMVGFLCITILGGAMSCTSLSLQTSQHHTAQQETRQYNFSKLPFSQCMMIVPNRASGLTISQEKDFETDVLGTITNAEEEQAMIDIKASMKNSIRFIYAMGASIGLGTFIVSAIDLLINPFIDRNIAIVLLPFSAAFLASLAMDYSKRGRKYVNA
jgi:hypothetical protein